MAEASTPPSRAIGVGVRGAGDEFYVGYLPVPARQRRFLWLIVPAILWALLAAAALIARSQPDPGNAVWDDATARTFTGVLIARPYPVVLAEDAGDGAPGALLLVELGKFGPGPRAAPFDGQRVRVSGWLLHRDDRRMLELEPGDGALRALNGAEPTSPSAPPVPRWLGRVTLRGEIVDSKCYLGAMKPGHGRTHKECATLCIRGGIPPMLVTRNGRGRVTCYLLMDPSGGALDAAAWPMIADPVEVSGDLEQWGGGGGLYRLRVRAADIRRL
ncbi:MAG: hypothetical protein ACKVU4_13845 [Phycisphaerales bacterium]